MKKIFLLLFSLVGMNLLIAQPTPKTSTLTTVSVPEIVKTAFKKEFPSIQPKWEADNKNYKAVYADPETNSKGIIIYDPTGKVITRDTEVNTAQPE